MTTLEGAARGRGLPWVRRVPLGTAVGVPVALVAVALVAYNLWAGNPVTASTLAVNLITAAALGSIYALAASGIVVTYTSTGLFNFAQGAMGMLLAFLYWSLVVEHGWPSLLALVVVVGVAGPLLGLLVYGLVMRHLVNAALVVQLVVTIGLMFGFMGLAQTIWDPSQARVVPFLFGLTGFHIGDTVVLWHRAITIGVAVALAVGLRLLLYRTRLGVTMRAVVDNGPLAALHGAAPARVAMTSWALSTSLAGLAGILLAPEVSVAVNALTLVTISAFAAAIVGRLRSLPLTFAGAMLLGLLVTFAKSFLDTSGRWVSLPDALPSVLLLVALLAMPQSRVRFAQLTGRLQRGPDRIPSIAQSAISMGIVVAVVAAVSAGMGQVNLNRLTVAVVTGVLLLSYIPLTGWAGQVSLAQITFAGIGAFTMWKVAGSSGELWGLLIAAAVAVPFGLLMALPALRLHGLYLALASLAFASLGEYLLFPQPEIFGSAGRLLRRPRVFGLDLADQRTMLLFSTVVFGVLAVGMVALRRGRFGRRLIALRDSEAASVTFGVNPIRTKLVVYGLSAGMAGFGGALLALQRSSATAQDFTMLTGIPLLLLVVVGGVETAGGALFGGVVSVFLIMIQDWLNVSWLNALEILGPGLLALGVARSPDGTVVDVSRALGPKLPWRRAVARPRPAPAVSVETPVPGPVEESVEG
jgi:branched-chain amino acid transport system permease protein